MDPHYKQIWLQALRSREYRQGSGNLKTDTGEFCCLGVLIDKIGCQWRRVNDNPIGRLAAFDDDGNMLSRKDRSAVEPDLHPEGYLSDEVLTKVGLTHTEQERLAMMNDGIGQSKASFTDIANYIEEKL